MQRQESPNAANISHDKWQFISCMSQYFRNSMYKHLLGGLKLFTKDYIGQNQSVFAGMFTFKKSTDQLRSLTFLSSVLVMLSFSFGECFGQSDSTEPMSETDRPALEQIEQLLKEASEVELNDTLKAVGYLNEALALAEQEGLLLAAAEARVALGVFYEAHFQYPRAMQQAEAALAIFSKAEDRKGIASVNVLLSDLFETTDRRAEAIKVLFESLAYYESVNDTLEIGRVLNRIANSQNYLGYHDDALLHYGRAMKMFEAVEYQRGVAVVLQNMAIIYGEEGDLRKAISNYLQTIAIYELLPEEPNLPGAYNNIGNDYKDLQMWDSAFYYFSKSLALSQVRNNTQYTAFTYSHLIEYYNALGDPQKGIEYGKKGLDLANQLGHSQLRINLNNSLADSYEALGQYKLALVHHRKYQTLEDSVYNIDNSQVIHDMQARYETEKKEKELLLKQSDIERQHVLLEEEARLRLVLIGGIVVVAMLAGFILRVERQKARAYDELSVKNSEIETKNKLIQAALLEKESLLKEIHHRVKNNLQVISSILNMQSRSMATPEMLSVIQEGQSRVKAMALIHQKLYQTEKLSEIDFQEYAEELTEHVSSIFQAPGTNGIVRRITSSDIKLDIDLAIPLGLILNELISNAYKYAFEGKTDGEIVVELRKIGEDQLQLEVGDNGKGLPADFNLEKAKSLGLKLVNILTRQLNGQLSVHSRGGAHFSILIQNIKLVV